MNIKKGDKFTDKNNVTEIEVMYVNGSWAGVKVIGIGQTALVREFKLSGFRNLHKLNIAK